MTLKKILVFMVVSFLLLFLFATPLFAFTSKSGEGISITKSIKDDVYSFGGTINVESDIEGDFVSAGGKIQIDGNISQDLIAAGGYLTINGDVGDDVRVAGGTITINGNIADDSIISGGQIAIGQNTKIGGDLLVSGGAISIDGEVAGDVQGSGGTINISGKVDGGVYIDSVGSLIIADGAEIAGDLIYTSSNEADISEGAVIGGEIKPTITEKAAEIKVPRKAGIAIFTATYIGGKVVSFLSLFVLGIILILAVPGLFNKFNKRMQATLGRCVGAGAIMLFGVPIGVVILFLIAVLLFITIVGAGLGVLTLSSNFILIILYFVLIYVSSVFLSFFIGDKILSFSRLDLNKYGWKVLAYLIGLVIIVIAYSIPFVGWIIRIAGILFGFGGLMLVIKDWFAELKKV